MATRKRLSLICEIQNFANAYLGKVAKFQGYSLFRFGVLSNSLAWRWKTPPPPPPSLCMNRVNAKGLLVCQSKSNSQTVLPGSLRSLAYSELHDNLGHLRVERVMQLAKARVFWPKMQADVTDYI